MQSKQKNTSIIIPHLQKITIILESGVIKCSYNIVGVFHMHDIGTRLRELRKRKGWTQKHLAQYLHKSTAAVGSYEQNVQTPPTDVLISLAGLYHISIDELLGLTGEESFTVDGLSERQKAVLGSILDEFHNPTGDNRELSPEHFGILNALIQIFIGQ